MESKSKQIYFAWTGFQRRQISMAPHIGFETVFLPVERRMGKGAKAVAYLRNAAKSLAIMIKERPKVIWVQLPQVPLMWVALLYRAIFGRDVTVIADCHNAMFRPPWSKVPFGLSLLSRCDVVLAHNEDIGRSALAMGVAKDRLMVVECPPANLMRTGTVVKNADMPRPWFVFPASFADDEPIPEVLEAARMTPGVSILITGNTRHCKDPSLVANAPPNVRFVGFLSREDFDALILGCDAVIAFTRFDGIQLSVCGEAIGARKPMLISETKTLRHLFPKGTVFVNSDRADDIAAGFHELLSRRKLLEKEIWMFADELNTRWSETRGKSLIERIDAKLALYKAVTR